MSYHIKKNVDIVLIILFPIIATILSFLFEVNGFWSIVLFFGLPSLYLSFKGKQFIKKSLIFSVVCGVPIIIILDYICHITNQWFIPHSILPFRLFGVVTLEVIFWAVLNVYFVIMFYEYFLDHHFTKKILYPNMKYLLIIALFLFIIFITFYFYFPAKLNIPYFYVIFGIILLLVPIFIQLFTHPNLISKFIITGSYFFYLTFIYEITALKLGLWSFPGLKFIGWVSILGVKFPIEEFIFWIMLLAIAILSYYEFFDDDEK